MDVTAPAPTVTLDENVTADDIVNAAEAGGKLRSRARWAAKPGRRHGHPGRERRELHRGRRRGNTFSINVPGAALAADADLTIQASISTTDAAGNTARAGDAEAYTVDVSRTPTIDLSSTITADDVINAAEAGGNVAVTGTVGGEAKVATPSP